MKTLAEVRRELAAGQFEFSRHAFRRAVERNISEQEIRQAGARAEVIEDLPGGQILVQRAPPGLHQRWTSSAFPGILGPDALDQDHHPV